MLTDNERRAVALLSLEQNPYTFSGTNYISPIVSSFDGTQFGDPSLVNDDIFALLPLSASGYSASDDMIAKDIQFLVSKQRPDGSWEGSVDLTASVIQALQAFNAAPDSVAKAIAYLQTNQQNDGGFGSVYSTSWAMQAGATWSKNGKAGADYLASSQAPDGAAIPGSESTNNRVWATSYAIPAVLGKSWSTIMHPVPKPQVVSTGSSSATQTETAKTPEVIIQKTEESKPEELPVEVAPKVAETQITLTHTEKPKITPQVENNMEEIKTEKPVESTSPCSRRRRKQDRHTNSGSCRIARRNWGPGAYCAEDLFEVLIGKDCFFCRIVAYF